MKNIDDKDLVDVSGGGSGATSGGLKKSVPIDGIPGDGGEQDDDDHTVGDDPGGNTIPM